jgi:hypothetical protein
MDYNKHPIEHVAYVVNGEKIWAHWGEVCPSTHSMLPITKTTFAHVVQLVKAISEKLSAKPIFLGWL